LSSINWSGISAGDTLWLAGGLYTNYMVIGKGGTAGNPVYIKRVLSTDSTPTSASGWSSAFDSQVIICSPVNAVNTGEVNWNGSAGGHIYMDGRTSSWSGTNETLWTCGIELLYNTNTPSSAGQGGCLVIAPSGLSYNSGLADLAFTNIDMNGGGQNAPQQYVLTSNGAIKTSPLLVGSSSDTATNGHWGLTLTHCLLHASMTGPILYQNRMGVLFDHCRLFCTGYVPGGHFNEFEIYGDASGSTSYGSIWCIRYCDLSDWQTEGMRWWYVCSTNTCYFYGNVVHDAVNANDIFEPDLGASSIGPIVCVNNTIYSWKNSTFQIPPSQFANTNGCLFANNLYVNAGNEYNVGGVPNGAKTGTWNYNYANNNIINTSYQDANSINNSGINPLVSPGVGGNFMIVSNVGALYPRNAGTVITNMVDSIFGAVDFSKDPNGNTRGADGAWDIGAYEYGTNVTSLNGSVISVSPMNINFGTIPTNQVSSQTFSVQNNGGGVLTGAATVAAPFSITNGSYSLGAGQSQLISIQFAPNTTGAVTNAVTFTVTGGTGTNAMVYGIGSVNPPPTVSAISANASDVDQSQSGLQIYSGTVVSFSATASNALTYQWSYTVNGGISVVFQGGSGTVPTASFSYGTNTIGNTYVWTLSVSNSQGSAQSQFTLNVESPPMATSDLTFAAQNGSVTAPFVFGTNGMTIYFYQPIETDGINSNGIATYSFTITNAGNYEVEALVNAPNSGENSLYVNIDAIPVDPTMIWDVALTTGFEDRLISWRGNGTDTTDQFVPWIFPLTNGVHQILFYGREADTQVAWFSILPAPPTPAPPTILVQ